MARIHVAHVGGDEYEVEVRDDSGVSEHRVTAAPARVEELGGGADAEALIEESFRFLLEREPKEAILSTFELSVISRYFPEYPDEIRRRVGG